MTVDVINPNKAGFFEGQFFWEEGQSDCNLSFKKNLSNINITSYNCETTYLE